MIEIIYAHCSASWVSEGAYLYWLPYLSDKMQKQVLNYKRKQDAYLALAGKVLLQKGLRKLGYESSVLQKIEYSSFQKPFIANETIDFNISHSGNYVVVAYSQSCRVGIDVEQLIPVQLQDFREQMSVEEWATISAATDSQNAFYNYYTQKEAVLKANGKGMNIPLKSFQIKNESTFLEGEQWYLKEIILAKGYSCHLATNHQQPVTIYDLTKEVWDIA